MTGRSAALVTGSLGNVGAAAVRRFAAMGLSVVGVDNDARRTYFGDAASTAANRARLEAEASGYRHVDIDIRDAAAMEALIADLGPRLAVVLHAAAQPSHDWAARAPVVDFEVNALATLTLLEAVRRRAPEAAVIVMSTNKVYGDAPNRLPLRAGPTRFELDPAHPFAGHGIDESLPIDQSRHSIFGVSKAAADLMAQEYHLRFGLATVVLRAGCVAGPGQRAVRDHGFLAFLCREVKAGRTYRIIGHGGLQVRDNLHVDDLADACARAAEAPRPGVYNIGGGPGATVSVIEALDIAGRLAGRPARTDAVAEARYGDHKWWVSDARRFQAAYPGWAPRWDAEALIAALVADADG